uniref:Uncharacterized protein n=1 Tax=Arundo donax TaxID=35708 RepID=A0A0A9HGV4_ARUDO
MRTTASWWRTGSRSRTPWRAWHVLDGMTLWRRSSSSTRRCPRGGGRGSSSGSLACMGRPGCQTTR